MSPCGEIAVPMHPNKYLSPGEVKKSPDRSRYEATTNTSRNLPPKLLVDRLQNCSCAMRPVYVLFIFGLFGLSAPVPVAFAQDNPTSRGEVVKIDEPAGKITVR